MSSERLAFGSGGRVKRTQRAERAETIARRGRGHAESAEPKRVTARSASPRSLREIVSAPSAAAAPERRDWAFMWMLIFTAAVFVRPQDLIPPIGVLHLPELAAVAGLATLFSRRLRRGETLIRMTPEFAGVILMGVVIVLTAPFSIWVGGAVHLFLDQYSKVILVYLLAMNVLSSPRRLERFTWVVVLSVSYVALLTMIHYARGEDMIGWGTRERGAVGGIMGNPNDLAMNMVCFLPFAAFIAMRKGSTVRRGLAAFCALLMVMTTVVTGSRGGFLGFMAMTLVLAAFVVRRRPGLLLAGALAALCALPIVPSSYWVRLQSITNQQLDVTGSAQARQELMKESLQAFLDNPITGVGAGQFVNWEPDSREQSAHEAHDVFLQVAADLGVAGLVLIVFLIGRAFVAIYQTRRLIRGARRQPRSETALDEPAIDLLDAHSAAMAAAMTGWMVCALFGSVAYNWTFYYLLVLAAAPRDILRDALPRHARAATRALSALRMARA